jgi:HAMP domain-containing protein/HD superfamily phosphodiesterase
MKVFAFPLVFHLSTLFGLLMGVTVAALTWLGYERSVTLIEVNGTALAEQSAGEVRQAVDAAFAPVELAVSLIGDHQVNDESTWQGRMRHIPLFMRALDVAAPATAYYVGYRNGDFFMVRRLRSEADRGRFGADPQTAYVVQSIDWENGRADGRVIHLDAAGRALRHIDDPAYPASYDPRQRPWFARAQLTDGVARTDPYIFTTTREVGLTFSKQGPLSGTVVGADLSLMELSEVAGRQKPTPASRVVLVDKIGWVIAADGVEDLVETGRRGWLGIAHVESFASAPVQAFSRLGGEAGRLLRFEADGGTYFGIRLPVQLRSGDSLDLIITIPQGELLAAAHSVRREMLLVSALVFVIALAATLFAAYSISRSLARLTRAAERFQRFDFAKPLRARSHIREICDLVGSFRSLQDTLRRYRHLLDMISRERDLTSLQPAILHELSAVLAVKKAVLYVVPQQADGLVVAAHKDGSHIRLVEASRTAPDPVPALVGDALATGERQVVAGPVTADETRLPGVAAVAPPEAGFACALCYPLRDRRDRPVGAVLFLDAGNAGAGARALVGALTGIAAVLLETRQLIASEKALFNAFIALIAGAIDAKSPYTGSHCARVPELTKMLAQAAVEATEGPFSDFSLSEDQWQAVHVAAWLHDCGKITSPEFVIDKATKLETIYDRIHEVRMRFEVLKRDAEIERLEAVQAGADPEAALALRDAQWRQLDEEFAFVARCNEGGEFLGEEQVTRLRAIARRTWQRTLDDTLGISHDERRRKAAQVPPLPVVEPLLADRPDHIIPRPAREVLGEENPWGFKMRQPEHLYDRGELHNLSISRGTLTDEERYKINDHMIQTIIMLSALPYPRHLRTVPELAGGHHERMDGKGYPRRLSGEEMSPVARMMAVADIFEALTAADRPYKKGKTLSGAIGIMARMAREGHIDPEIFELFLTSGIYRRYAERYMPAELIDDIVIETYLPPRAAE